jgi:nucleoid-associated protein YgaU
MQQIERYGVIALVFLLVTIVAISFWGDSKSPGFWSRLTGKGQPKKEEVAKAPEAPALPPQIADPNLPTSPASPTPGPQNVVSLGGTTQPSVVDHSALGAGTLTPPGTGPVAGTLVDPAAPGTLVPPPSGTKPSVVSDPAPAPKAPSAAGNEYVVQKGDSLAKIARARLGAESRWQEIVTLNPNLNPKSLQVGQKIQLPKDVTTVARPAAPRKEAPDSKEIKATAKPATKLASAPAKSGEGRSTRTCQVQKGDTLRSIARRELGDERRWKEIAAVNPSLDPSRLTIGMSIHLPASAGGELVAKAEPAAVPEAPKARVR